MAASRKRRHKSSVRRQGVARWYLRRARGAFPRSARRVYTLVTTVATLYLLVGTHVGNGVVGFPF